MTSDDTAPSRIHLPDAPADQRAILEEGGVACWSEPVMIDTYEPGAPDRYPLFLDRRVYQGSSGRVYPLPMIDSVSHTKAPRAWEAIHLENAYVRLMLLPEIGGRIHIGYDKVADYDFFYRNNVIKPALVGLAGPWISGGVEFNWPQHHRPATFLPIRTRIEREPDGAVVVWHSDLDPLQRMRGTHGIRLRGDSTLIEAEVSLHNRTDVPQTFLWWANVAARSHEGYQSFFPDDVAYVADHARRAITAFPRADRAYYGVDYPALADGEHPDADRIDFYSNIPVPTSYMITDTDDDFFGGYDHHADAGFVHWADRSISPGKKQWTWGDGAIGRAWDAQLTDEDGPYVELMAGVYTDNQPDFSWLAPGETKQFSQFWYPIHAIGPARQATRDAAVTMSHPDGAEAATRIGVLATSSHPMATITVLSGQDEVARWDTPLTPDMPLVREFDSIAIDVVEVATPGRVLVRWVRRTGAAAVPWVATAPDAPSEISSNDELYVTAVHLTQYRHPSRSPIPYLEEALSRDDGDARSATALGAWHLRRGEYADARRLLERASARLTRRNLNPPCGEASYLLGLTLERLGETEQADACYAKAAWNAQWSAPAALARARLALRAHRAGDALVLADQGGAIPEARRVGVLALRALGRQSEADAALQDLWENEPLDAATAALLAEVDVLDPRTPLDVAIEFARAGALAEALAATSEQDRTRSAAFGAAGPLRHYLRAMWWDGLGATREAEVERSRASASDATYAFPAGLDHFDALRAAVRANDDDATAHALLGMWLLDSGRLRESLTHLRRATLGGAADPVTWRNLALTIVQTGGDCEEADSALVRALTYGRDARVVFERDVLAQVRGLTSAHRLALMEEYTDVVADRDDLALQHITLLMDAGRAREAWSQLNGRTFRPFEGGEGRVIAAYDRASCALARATLHADPASAAAFLAAGVAAPASLGEGRHPADPQAERYVLLGDALRASGDEEGAQAAWASARSRSALAVAPQEISGADFWVGVAHHRLGENVASERVWRALHDRADRRESGKDDVDYFATSLPELLLFDTDTAAARSREAAHLRDLAERGRALGETAPAGASARTQR